MLERGLAEFAGDDGVRPELCALLCESARIDERWSTATWALEELQASAVRASEKGAAGAEVLALRAASLRCQLEVASGLVERAWMSLAEVRAAVERLAGEPTARLVLLHDSTTVALASVTESSLSAALAELSAALADEAFVRAVGEAGSGLVARRALLVSLREELSGPAGDDGALRGALALETLDPVHRASVALFLYRRGREQDRPESRALALAALRALGDALPPELAAARAAAETLEALAAGTFEASAPAVSELRRAQEQRLAALASRPERSGGFGYLTFQHRRLVSDAWLRLAQATGGAERALESELAEKALGSLARRLGCAPGSVAELRNELLAPGSALLAFLPGLDVVHVFALDGDGLAHAAVPWRYELEPGPRELAELLSASPTGLTPELRGRRLQRLETLARDLADRLFPPALAGRLAAARALHVSGAELLGPFPLECLPLGDTALGLRLPLAHLPSLPLGLALAREAARDGEPRPFKTQLVAAPAQAPGLQRRWPQLVPLELEPATLARLAGGGAPLVGGEAGTRALFARLADQPPSFLNLLVHGVSDARRELPGGLVLAPDEESADGILWNDALASHAFRSPPLVALTACYSARGPRRVGDDGLARLSGTFFERGARVLVQAGSELALEPSARLMVVFTQEVQRGRSPSEALWNARRELARDPAFDHPFHLFALKVIGLGLLPVHPLR